MLKGYLLTMNGNCSKDLEGIYTIFLPTKDKVRALKYVEGNGEVLSCIEYEVDIELLTDTERLNLLDRVIYFQ